MTKILAVLVDMILPLAVGCALRRISRLRSVVFDHLMEVGLVGLTPLLGCLSVWAIRLETTLLWLPALGVAMQVVPGVLALIRARTKYDDPRDKGGYVLAGMLSNRGVVGMLSVFAIYGQAGYALFSLVILLAWPVVQLLCFPLAEHCHQSHLNKEQKHNSLRSPFLTWRQIPLLGLVVGIILNLHGVARPAVVEELLPYLVHLSAWLFVLPVGHALELREMRAHWRDPLDLVWVKFLMTPLCIYLLSRLVGVEGLALNVALILSFAPTAINAVVISKLYQLNTHLALVAFVLTTVVYMAVVLPLLMWQLG